MTRRRATAGLALAGLLLAGAAESQTATAGSLSGAVRSTAGTELDGVEITLSREGEAWERVVPADRGGRFESGFLVPGEYEAFVERFGYVPLRVEGIRIRSGRHAVIEVELREAPPPVTEVDRVTWAAVGRERALSLGQPVSRRQIRRIPHEGREVSGVLSRWSLAGTNHEVQGLPGRYTTLDVDGLRHTPAAHPALGPGPLHLSALPTAFLQDIELVTQGVDVEWGYTPGGMLRATTVRGTDQLEIEGFGSASGAPLGTSGVLGGNVPSAYGPEVGALVRGPIRTDTAHYAVGLQARREARPQTPLAASIAPEGESFRELTEVGTSRAETWDILSGFGRADWQVGPAQVLTFRSNLGVVRGRGEGAAPLLSPDGLDGTDLMVGASFVTEIGERGLFELRTGFEASSRRYGASDQPLPRSWIHEGGIVTGADPMVPGEFSKRAWRVAPVARQGFGRHQLKFGAFLSSHAYREEAGRMPSEGFLFPDLDAFRQGRGLRLRSTGPMRYVELDGLQLGAFLQDRWTPSEQFALTAGVRIDGEALPWDEILPNDAWEQHTGLDRAMDRSLKARIAPRLALEWSPTPGGAWLVRGSTGLYHGEIDRALLAEVLADSGAVRVQRTLGRTGSWPEGGAPTGFTSQGAYLSILGPRFDAPRTRSSEAALYHVLDERTTLEIGVGQRRTEFLPRRRDLNRSAARYASDQFGREIFGQVVQAEGVISILPGSDRRFPDFDVVSGIESDGWSEWWGLTAGATYEDPEERTLEARYTFSRTTDNLPGFGGGWPAAIAGRPATGGSDPGWVAGRSDLDAPHRLALTGSLPVRADPDIRIGGLYAFHSGTPFTPGVRDALHGSDPLGWNGTAPVTVPAELASALDPLASRWSCLRGITSGPLERNACRTDGMHEVNVRVDAGLGRSGDWNLRLVVDALNLLDAGRIVPDPALFVVDGDAPFDPSLDGGIVALPVAVNPAFGEPLLTLSSGRALRIGLEVRH